MSKPFLCASKRREPAFRLLIKTAEDPNLIRVTVFDASIDDKFDFVCYHNNKPLIISIRRFQPVFLKFFVQNVYVDTYRYPISEQHLCGLKFLFDRFEGYHLFFKF